MFLVNVENWRLTAGPLAAIAQRFAEGLYPAAAGRLCCQICKTATIMAPAARTAPATAAQNVQRTYLKVTFSYRLRSAASSSRCFSFDRSHFRAVEAFCSPP